MTLYVPHSIFHLAQLLYVRPETFGPYYVAFPNITSALAPLRFKHDMCNYGLCTRFVTDRGRYPKVTAGIISALNLVTFESFRVVF